MNDPEALQLLAKRLGYTNGPSENLTVALTHRTFINEEAAHGRPGLAYNERLEFLGDAVVGLAVGDLLMHAHPEVQEGALTRMRSILVCEHSLAELSRKLGVGQALRLGRGEAHSGGRNKDVLLGDAYEAMMGAVYLDFGFERAREIVREHFEATIADATLDKLDPKTALQEKTQSLARGLPTYTVIACDGPDHSPKFTVEVTLQGEFLARGEGCSKRIASENGARNALAVMNQQSQENWVTQICNSNRRKNR